MVARNREYVEGRSAMDENTELMGDPVQGDRDRLMVRSVVMVVIVMATFVGWMFHGFSLVGLFLPDAAAAAPSAVTAQSKAQPPAQQLYAWLAQVASPLDALIVVRDRIAAAATHLDDTGIRRECDRGQAFLPRIQEHLPSPDLALNAALQRTVDDYRMAFAECLTETRHQDAAGVELAAVYLYRANEDLQATMAIIRRDLADYEPDGAGVVRI